MLADFLTRALTWAIFLEACFVSLLLMLAAGYVIPQILYRRSRGKWLAPLVPFLRALTLAMKPATATLNFFYKLVEVADKENRSEEPATPAENIEALITAGTEEGLIQEEDRKLIQSVVEFGDKMVREVMTPRPNIVAISADATLEELRQLVINEQYSRIPIYEGIDRRDHRLRARARHVRAGRGERAPTRTRARTDAARSASCPRPSR